MRPISGGVPRGKRGDGASFGCSPAGTLGQRGQTHVRHRVAEERHAEASLAKFFGWVDDTVGCRLELQLVTVDMSPVDHQLVGQCSHWGQFPAVSITSNPEAGPTSRVMRLMS